MAQLHGHIIEHDGQLGIVQSVGSARIKQPDLVTRDADTGEELERAERPLLDVQQVHVRYEDGSEGTLTEHLDQWTVLGSVAVFPDIKDPANPPPGAFGELPEQQAATAAVDVAAYAAELRAAAPLAEARAAAERHVEVVDDGALTLVEE